MYHFIFGLRELRQCRRLAIGGGSPPCACGCVFFFVLHNLAADSLLPVQPAMRKSSATPSQCRVRSRNRPPEIHSEQEHRDDDHRGRGLHFFQRRRGHLLHLGAHIVVKRLDPLRPGLHPARRRMLLAAAATDICHSSLSQLPSLQPASIRPKTLAGAEGFEPPSSVLETDSLTVELTPLNS